MRFAIILNPEESIPIFNNSPIYSFFLNIQCPWVIRTYNISIFISPSDKFFFPSFVFCIGFSSCSNSYCFSYSICLIIDWILNLTLIKVILNRHSRSQLLLFK